jgi:hypothetical protein
MRQRAPGTVARIGLVAGEAGVGELIFLRKAI